MSVPFARAVIRLRLLIIVFWVVVAGVAIPRASRVNDVLRVEGQTLVDTESGQATRLIREDFKQPVAHFFAVAIAGPVPVDSLIYQVLLDTLGARALGESYIDRVVSHRNTADSSLVSKDRKTTFVIATVAVAHADTATDLAEPFRASIHGLVEELPWASEFRVQVTGGPALDYDVRTLGKVDSEQGERRALPLAMAVLILAFGAIIAAILPIIVGVFAISCALALVHVAATFQPMSVFVLSIVSMVGLGVGIDYSLLVVTRFREELNRGLGANEAAMRTITTAGRAVTTSGLTVIVGFAALLTIPLTETRSVAIGGLLVVGAAVLLSTTLLPAILSILGRAVDWPRWLARRLAWYHAPAAWERWARWLGHHPWRALLIGGVAVASVTWPLIGIEIGLPRSGWFPSETESGRGVEILESMGSRGALQPVRVIVQAPPGERIVSSRYVRGLRRLSDSIRADPRVASVRSVVDLRENMSVLRYTLLYSDMERARERSPEFYDAFLTPDNNTTLLDALLADSTSFRGAMDVVRRIRTLADSGITGLSSTNILVGGFAAASVDLQEDLLQRFPRLIGLVVITTAIMLFIAFRSILVPIKAVVMNCLSVAGAFGLIVLVFQWGVGSQLFGLEGATEAVYVVVPVLVFAVVFGLSMDYEVFLLSRIKEEFDRSGRNDHATMEGLSATASVITSAAAIMIIVFGTFSFARVLAVQLMGFGLAVAVFLDATLIRMVLVPSLMHIAGRWNWWPGVRGTRGERGDRVSGGAGQPRAARPSDGRPSV